jgi:hypothetical protein
VCRRFRDGWSRMASRFCYRVIRFGHLDPDHISVANV